MIAGQNAPDDPFWLDDAQWAAVAASLPADQRGPKRVDDRRVISGIVHVLWSGCAWRACPAHYGPYMTVFNRYNRWQKSGVWRRILDAMPPDIRAQIEIDDSIPRENTRRRPLPAHRV